MCLLQVVIDKKNVFKLKLDSIWNNLQTYLQRLTCELSLGGPLAIGLRSWKHNDFTWLYYQLPATCVNLGQSGFNVSAVIRIEKNWLR